MKERLLSVWDAIHTSFWFVPCVMALAALLFSLGTVAFDQRSTSIQFANSLGFVWSGGAEGARSLLSTIAGSLITVAGVVFSITIVALTLASSQFGPRLLRNFLQDTGNQITLGTFIATFLYCILVLRTIRSPNEGGFIPFFSITCGLAFCLASLGVLIFFIHHVAISIQAENLLARVGQELSAGVIGHFPETGSLQDQEVARRSFDQHLAQLRRVPIPSDRCGYLQRIDRDTLVSRAQKDDFWIAVKKSPGDFVITEEVLADIWIRPGKESAVLNVTTLNKHFVLGQQRTESQDVLYGARQLSEIAARALSPGINDPYTAIGCIEWMSVALSIIVRRSPAPQLIADGEGTHRLLETTPTLETMCSAMLEPIIAYGLSSALVARQVINSLCRVAGYVTHPADARVLEHYSQRVASQAKIMLKDQEALSEVLTSADKIQQQLTLTSFSGTAGYRDGG